MEKEAVGKGEVGKGFRNPKYLRLASSLRRIRRRSRCVGGGSPDIVMTLMGLKLISEG